VTHKFSLDVMVKKNPTLPGFKPQSSSPLWVTALTELSWFTVKFIIIHNVRLYIVLKTSKLNQHPTTWYYPGKEVLRYDWSDIRICIYFQQYMNELIFQFTLFKMFVHFIILIPHISGRKQWYSFCIIHFHLEHEPELLPHLSYYIRFSTSNVLTCNKIFSHFTIPDSCLDRSFLWIHSMSSLQITT
jgi:hypothetical protein